MAKSKQEWIDDICTLIGPNNGGLIDRALREQLSILKRTMLETLCVRIRRAIEVAVEEESSRCAAEEGY
ncbi:MAG TPA: hypothetical protein VI756_10420 [Blastocatellia bacterium]